MYLVSARKKQSSLSVGVPSATEALRRMRNLKAEGYTVFIFDISGRERSVDEIEAYARADARLAL